MPGDVRIGILGWRYRGSRGIFYPPKLPRRTELAFAAKNFNSIEINGTHYSLQRPGWIEAQIVSSDCATVGATSRKGNLCTLGSSGGGSGLR
jgi:hypothetical protein